MEKRVVKLLLLKAILIFLGLLVLVGVVVLAIQVSDRSPAVSDATLTITPAAVEQGEAMQMDVKVFYRRSCQSRIIRKLYDSEGDRYALPDLVLPAGPPGFQHSVSTIVTSPKMGLGEARYISSPSYACNWFQRWFWPMHVPDRFAAFYVLPRKESNVSK